MEPPSSDAVHRVLSSVATITVSIFGGGLAGYALLRQRPKSAATAFAHLPSLWAVRTGAFATVFEGGKVVSEIGRSACEEQYASTLPVQNGSTAREFEMFIASKTHKYTGAVVDSVFAGGLAGVLGSKMNVQTMFNEGGKVMRMSSANKLTVPFIVGAGAALGAGAGVLAAAALYVEDLAAEEMAQQELMEPAAFTAEQKAARNQNFASAVGLDLLESADEVDETMKELEALREELRGKPP